MKNLAIAKILKHDFKNSTVQRSLVGGVLSLASLAMPSLSLAQQNPAMPDVLKADTARITQILAKDRLSFNFVQIQSLAESHQTIQNLKSDRSNLKKNDVEISFISLMDIQSQLHIMKLDMNSDKSYEIVGTTKAEFAQLLRDYGLQAAHHAYDEGIKPANAGREAAISLKNVQTYLQEAGFPYVGDDAYAQFGVTWQAYCNKINDHYLIFAKQQCQPLLAKPNLTEIDVVVLKTTISNLEQSGVDTHSENMYVKLGTTKEFFDNKISNYYFDQAASEYNKAQLPTVSDEEAANSMVMADYYLSLGNFDIKGEAVFQRLHTYRWDFYMDIGCAFTNAALTEYGKLPKCGTNEEKLDVQDKLENFLTQADAYFNIIHMQLDADSFYKAAKTTEKEFWNNYSTECYALAKEFWQEAHLNKNQGRAASIDLNSAESYLEKGSFLQYLTDSACKKIGITKDEFENFQDNQRTLADGPS